MWAPAEIPCAQEWGGVAYPADKICLPYVCSVVDVSMHDLYGGSHPQVEVYSGMNLDDSLVGTDYEAYLTASLTSCAVGACCFGVVLRCLETDACAR